MIKNLPGEKRRKWERASQAKGAAETKALLIYIERAVNPNNPELFHQASGESWLHSFFALIWGPKGQQLHLTLQDFILIN